MNIRYHLRAGPMTWLDNMIFVVLLAGGLALADTRGRAVKARAMTVWTVERAKVAALLGLSPLMPPHEWPIETIDRLLAIEKEEGTKAMRMELHTLLGHDRR